MACNGSYVTRSTIPPPPPPPPPPARGISLHPVKTMIHLKTFEFIGHLETR